MSIFSENRLRKGTHPIFNNHRLSLGSIGHNHTNKNISEHPVKTCYSFIKFPTTHSRIVKRARRKNNKNSSFLKDHDKFRKETIKK